MRLFERGKSCRFKLADVISPEREQIFKQITVDLDVLGEIVFLSDQGNQPDRFAIVEVEGIESPLIVPIECLQPVTEVERKNPNLTSLMP